MNFRINPAAANQLHLVARKLCLKITVLGADKFGMMENMHRWQKQVNLPLSEEEKDNDQYITHDEVGRHDLTWVDMKGMGVHTVSVPFDPMAGKEGDLLPAMMNQGGRVPFKYTAPEGWVQQPPRKFLLEVFQIADKKTEVTLSTAGGDPASNINRWRDLIGLADMTKEDAAKTVKMMNVAGAESAYVDIANPAGPPTKNRTIGVIVPMKNRSSFFIKMSGPIAEVELHKAEFETFVKSFKK